MVPLLSRGHVICLPESPVKIAARLRVQIVLTGSARVPMIKGQQLQLHVHTCEQPVHVTKLVSLLSKDGEVERNKPRCLAGTASAIVELAIADGRPICIEHYSDFRKLGRFLLRDRGETVAFGIVKKILRNKKSKAAAGGATGLLSLA